MLTILQVQVSSTDHVLMMYMNKQHIRSFLYNYSHNIRHTMYGILQILIFSGERTYSTTNLIREMNILKCFWLIELST